MILLFKVTIFGFNAPSCTVHWVNNCGLANLTSTRSTVSKKLYSSKCTSAKFFYDNNRTDLRKAYEKILETTFYDLFFGVCPNVRTVFTSVLKKRTLL